MLPYHCHCLKIDAGSCVHLIVLPRCYSLRSPLASRLSAALAMPRGLLVVPLLDASSRRGSPSVQTQAMLGFKSEFRAVMRCRTQTGNIIPCVMSLRYQW